MDWLFLGFAFATGAVAFLNPCGVVVLGSYLTHFFEQKPENTLAKNALRGILSGLATTLGFIAVFSAVGFAITWIGRTVIAYIPWLNMLLGFSLVVIAVTMLFGKKFYWSTAIPLKVRLGSVASFFPYGIVYAVASLGCTLPLFLGVVVGSLAQGGFTQSILVFLAYALGMGASMVVVTLASAITQGAFSKKVNALMPHIQRLSAETLLIVGLYLIAFQLYSGNLFSFSG